ncbi:head-tail connector protein [Polymorphum gilvum]|uniref:PhiE125 gp8 family phage protein n=1 Tax=Polymorphum gilvum (strain LMG 25793 / CGMCC 1.9160 / SL003B-26A1) TaxID=991905 RepID=F2IV20_POLGS|nr:head-tail connector protein [Polymorphum gilvum]ADZ71351.1 hypothetical protein SL003B_2928 [Polymorphum gilvum SL003B-26A1]
MTAVLTNPPAVEPVTVEDMRAHLRLAHEAEDALLAELIAAARSQVERETRRALIAQGWRAYFDAWPAGRIVRLPVAPVIAVAAVTVYGTDGLPADLDPVDWRLDGPAARLRVAAGAGGDAANGIEIDFTAGYGAAPADVPAPLRQAIRLLAAHWYEHREAGSDLALASVPHGLDRLLSVYRVPRL